MSFCRWSSDNWMCDVYVYEDVSGGYTTHVAGRRCIVPPIPDILWSLPRFGVSFDDDHKAVYPSRWHRLAGRAMLTFGCFWHNKIHMASVKLMPLRDIGLPFDGERFNDETAEECADTLEWLRSEGYRVPQYAIDALREEE